jgi:hypothetical protein
MWWVGAYPEDSEAPQGAFSGQPSAPFVFYDPSQSRAEHDANQILAGPFSTQAAAIQYADSYPATGGTAQTETPAPSPAALPAAAASAAGSAPARRHAIDVVAVAAGALFAITRFRRIRS